MSGKDKRDNSRTDCAVDRRKVLLGGTTITASVLAAATPVQTAQAQQRPAAPAAGQKPNILFIMGDDIGWFNVSAYNMGIMGYRTPNIDRVCPVMKAARPAVQLCWPYQSVNTAPSLPMRSGSPRITSRLPIPSRERSSSQRTARRRCCCRS
jgi:hypothetical protein